MSTVTGGGSEMDRSLRFFLERSPLMMGTVALLPDGDLLHLYDNPATTMFLGAEPGETAGRTARGLGVPEPMIALWRRHYEQADASGAPVSFEYAHDHRLGARILAVTVAALGPAEAGGAPQFSYIAEDVTERRAAEAALGDSEAGLRAVFDQAAVGLALVGLDGRWLKVNRRLCDMLGYAEAELAALRFQDLTHRDDLDADLANVERLLAGQASSYAMEKRYYHRSGGPIWAHLSVSLLRNAEGEPDRFIAVVEDISARKAVESALRLTDRRLAMAARAAGLGVWEWVSGAEHVHYSARAREICGFSSDERLTLGSVIARVHPDDRDMVAARAGRERGPADDQAIVEYRIVHPREGVRWVRASSTIVAEDNTDSPPRLFGTLEDVTERRGMVEQLAGSEARLRLALEAGRMAVFDWPLHEAEPPLTPELRAQLHIPAGEPSSVEARRARYHPDDLALASSTHRRALESPERFLDFVFRYFWPDGQMRWLEVRSEILRAPGGEARRLVGVQLDITEQRENEERLRFLMREVDHRANNLLAVVQSLVSLSRAQDVGAYREVLYARIQALAVAHRLLAENRWSGADLGRLMQEELRPYGLGEDDRIGLDGGPVSLSPSQAQALGLALHELATNAAKHGALSVPAGAVAIAWRREGEALCISWRERGGPRVGPPSRRGFGSTVIPRSIAGLKGGRVEMDWAPAGLTVQLCFAVDDRSAAPRG